MPNIKSAKKRVEVTKKKTLINKSNRAELKTAIKKLNGYIDNGDLESAEAFYPEVVSLLDKSVSKGVYAKNTVANKKSGLAKRLNALKAAKAN